MALELDQVAPQRPRVDLRDRHPRRVEQGSDHERGLRGNALDAEPGVALVEKDLQGRDEDRSVAAGVTRPTGASRPGRVIGGRFLDRHGAPRVLNGIDYRQLRNVSRTHYGTARNDTSWSWVPTSDRPAGDARAGSRGRRRVPWCSMVDA